MTRFQELLKDFNSYFSNIRFPDKPEALYGAASHILEDGGKRIRPVLCLLANEMFSPIHPATWKIASAIELFHNFTLIHDDIMDRAPVRRGRPTVHTLYNEPTALLAGDVMLLKVYDLLMESDTAEIKKLVFLLNRTGAEICEGQQLDMEFEKQESVSPADYISMIERKTAVFLAAALQMGAIQGGASPKAQEDLYQFGRNLGLAFQVQDDWLDSFGNPDKFGKERGGDIRSNKKTFLLVHAMEEAAGGDRELMLDLLKSDTETKLEQMMALFRRLKVDEAAVKAKNGYMEKAWEHFNRIEVPDEKKKPLRELAEYLLNRET